MERKLASVQIAHHVEPIEGADKIELVKVLGWQCIAKKGAIKPMDKVVYFEIDSFLPLEPMYEFLKDTSFKKNPILGEGYKIETKKFRGVLSQGLVLPLSNFADVSAEFNVGKDLTNKLGVRKWVTEERATNRGTIIGDRPSWVPKTYETRVQSCPELLDEFKKCGAFYVTRKMDGTSVSMYYHEGKFGVCGHHVEYADDGKCSLWTYAKDNGLPEKFAKYGDIIVQGEFCGPNIQKNIMGLSKPLWYIFTIYLNGEHLDLYRTNAVCIDMKLRMIPVMFASGTQYAEEFFDMDKLLEEAKNVKYDNGAMGEGIVVRPTEPIMSDILSDYLSMKVINNDYLLKNRYGIEA